MRLGGRQIAWVDAHPGATTTFTAAPSAQYTWPATFHAAEGFRVVVKNAAGEIAETSGPLPPAWGTTPGVIAPGLAGTTATAPVPTLASATSVPLPAGNPYLPGYGTQETFSGSISAPLVGHETAYVCTSAWGLIPATDSPVATGFGCEAMRSTGQALLAHAIASPTTSSSYRILVYSGMGALLSESGPIPSSWSVPKPVS